MGEVALWNHFVRPSGGNRSCDVMSANETRLNAVTEYRILLSCRNIFEAGNIVPGATMQGKLIMTRVGLSRGTAVCKVPTSRRNKIPVLASTRPTPSTNVFLMFQRSIRPDHWSRPAIILQSSRGHRRVLVSWWSSIATQ